MRPLMWYFMVQWAEMPWVVGAAMVGSCSVYCSQGLPLRWDRYCFYSRWDRISCFPLSWMQFSFWGLVLNTPIQVSSGYSITLLTQYLQAVVRPWRVRSWSNQTRVPNLCYPFVAMCWRVCPHHSASIPLSIPNSIINPFSIAFWEGVKCISMISTEVVLMTSMVLHFLPLTYPHQVQNASFQSTLHRDQIINFPAGCIITVVQLSDEQAKKGKLIVIRLQVIFNLL